MGGYGSGGHNKIKQQVEGYIFIDSRQWQREGYFKKDSLFQYSWLDYEGKHIADIGVIINKNLVKLVYAIPDRVTGKKSTVRCVISLSWGGCNFNGQRTFFICPKCHKRVARLYLYDSAFTCRHCCYLNYRSSQSSGNMAARLSDKIYKERKKLKVYPAHALWDMIDIPSRPKGMHYSTYYRLIWNLSKLIEAHGYIFNEQVDKLLK